jgi:hypothetical protein
VAGRSGTKRGADRLDSLKLVLSKFDQMEINKDTHESKYSLWSLFDDHIDGWERSTGKMVAVPDLVGTQMIISLNEPLTFSVFGMPVCPRALQIRSRFEIESMSLDFGKREVSIKAGDLKKHTDQNGHTFWVYRFRDQAL